MRAQVKTFQTRKRGAPSSKSVEPRDNVSPSKVRRVNFSLYLSRLLGTLEEGSTKGSQVGKGQQEGILKKVK